MLFETYSIKLFCSRLSHFLFTTVDPIVCIFWCINSKWWQYLMTWPNWFGKLQGKWEQIKLCDLLITQLIVYTLLQCEWNTNSFLLPQETIFLLEEEPQCLIELIFEERFWSLRYHIIQQQDNPLFVHPCQSKWFQLLMHQFQIMTRGQC